MQRMQSVYPRLREVPAVPDAMAHPGFAAIEDHAMELSQRAVSDILEMLRRRRDFPPEHVCQQRKSNILSALSKLVPGSA
eukprot:3397880-Pyramimonas_sp.AAC.1